ncbi:MAG: hypothetical protein U1A78_28405 [Polyangia bacterium]
MEAFESFVALALEAEKFVVSSAVKFDVKRRTAKRDYEEEQQHGYEVDLVAARSDALVLATVKSFFGSGGVRSEEVLGTTSSEKKRKLYLLLNDPIIRDSVIKAAADRYGYRLDQIELRMYVGRFAAPIKGHHEKAIREWAATQKVGRGSIQIIGVRDVVGSVREAASRKQYRDNAVLVTMKVLEAAGILEVKLPDDIG